MGAADRWALPIAGALFVVAMVPFVLWLLAGAP